MGHTNHIGETPVENRRSKGYKYHTTSLYFMFHDFLQFIIAVGMNDKGVTLIQENTIERISQTL